MTNDNKNDLKFKSIEFTVYEKQKNNIKNQESRIRSWDLKDNNKICIIFTRKYLEENKKSVNLKLFLKK
jgi:hypothetical protein